MKTKNMRNRSLINNIKNYFFIENLNETAQNNTEQDQLKADPLYLNYRDAYQQVTRWK